MSSPGASESGLKAGHPPAVKAGGMRITQHKPPAEPRSTNDTESQSDEEFPESTSPPKQQLKQIINGVLVKGDADFPAEAVKAFHENKPVPQHENRSHNHKPMVIQQPRK